jgi:hypothetical protein
MNLSVISSLFLRKANSLTPLGKRGIAQGRFLLNHFKMPRKDKNFRSYLLTYACCWDPRFRIMFVMHHGALSQAKIGNESMLANGIKNFAK